MNIPPAIQEAFRQKLGQQITRFNNVAGGCINHGGKVTTPDSVFFIKWNDAARFPGMFSTEARGLQLLADTKCIRVPLVAWCDQIDGYQYIVQEFIEPGQRRSTYWQDLGRALASLHKVTSSSFGLDHNNYIGSLPQNNQPANNWIDFFVHHRIEPQLQLLKASSMLRRRFESLFKNLSSIFPEEPPSLLHGDLWNGNLLVDEQGNPCVIDPAVYFGHREMELAFTMLFGGFASPFYDTYKEVFPVAPGFSDRVDIYNLYPLLVHANLFGGHYVAEMEEIVSRWA